MNQKSKQQDEFDKLVPDRIFANELGVTRMTVWTWDHDPKFAGLMPKKVQINGRNYRSRNAIERLKRHLFQEGLKAATQ